MAMACYLCGDTAATLARLLLEAWWCVQRKPPSREYYGRRRGERAL